MQMVTPANTPATPPNFPETLLAFSKMSATGGNGSSANSSVSDTKSPFGHHVGSPMGGTSPYVGGGGGMNQNANLNAGHAGSSASSHHHFACPSPVHPGGGAFKTSQHHGTATAGDAYQGR